jgi:hypothetical protein
MRAGWFGMGKFSPTKHHGDCEEIANLSTAYGRRRRNWNDAHGTVPAGPVVDASCSNQRCQPSRIGVAFDAQLSLAQFD